MPLVSNHMIQDKVSLVVVEVAVVGVAGEDMD
jgi:hypothetical protein